MGYVCKVTSSAFRQNWCVAGDRLVLGGGLWHCVWLCDCAVHGCMIAICMQTSQQSSDCSATVCAARDTAELQAPPQSSTLQDCCAIVSLVCKSLSAPRAPCDTCGSTQPMMMGWCAVQLGANLRKRTAKQFNTRTCIYIHEKTSATIILLTTFLCCCGPCSGCLSYMHGNTRPPTHTHSPQPPARPTSHDGRWTP